MLPPPFLLEKEVPQKTQQRERISHLFKEVITEKKVLNNTQGEYSIAPILKRQSLSPSSSEWFWVVRDRPSIIKDPTCKRIYPNYPLLLSP